MVVRNMEEMKEPDSVLAPTSVPKYEKPPCHIRVTRGFWLGL